MAFCRTRTGITFEVQHCTSPSKYSTVLHHFEGIPALVCRSQCEPPYTTRRYDGSGRSKVSPSVVPQVVSKNGQCWGSGELCYCRIYGSRVASSGGAARL